MISTAATRIGKVARAIQSLPKAPEKRILWVVYNEDMVAYTTDLIKELRGEDYLEHVTVICKNNPNLSAAKGSVYFDPGLYDLLGNGNG